MGIQGLLPLLKSIMVPIHIKELEGCSVAVDTYSWLHKGALSCSRELCKGLPTSRHIEYCMHRVNLLRHYGVKPILVFDGGLLPMKLEQENKRARSRKDNLVRATEHEANGNHSAAYECYQKAVDISPSIAHALIQVLKRESVHYVVAPYEADAQMTFLAVTKQVDAVITEDSDLIPFGCPRIIFKMDKFGHAVEFQASMLHKNKELSFAGFSNQMLLEMCIFSGCDYLQSLPGMGLKRAHALITKFKSYDRVIKHLKYSTVSVPPLYEESFKKARLTFKHQRVYDPKSEDIVHLSDMLEELGEDSDFLGPSIPQHIAKGIAQGCLDPFTQMPFQAENVTPKLVVNDFSHPRSFKPENLKKKLDLPVQKNLLTKYFCFASLEAKRKFRAPRISPKCPSPTDDSSSTPEENVIVSEAPSSEASDLLASSSLSRESGDVSLTNSLGENGWISEVAENSESANDVLVDEMVGHQKELNCKNVAEEVERPKTDSVKVIVRSKYFVKKQAGPCLNDCSVICPKKDVKTVVNESNAPREKQSPKAITSPYFHHKQAFKDHQDGKDGCLTVVDRGLNDSITREAEGTADIERRKLDVSGMNFKQKHESKDHQGNKENLFFKGPSVTGAPENVIPQSALRGKSYFEGTTGKRKSLLEDNLQKENFNPKHMRVDETSPGFCEAGNGELFSGTKDESKFGSNISHISRYSDIAEKSVERFVSAISSFRYSGSGSRASGLRAPLKDVQNTCPKRPSSGPDFSQFSYVPSNRNTNTGLRRL